MMLLTVVETEKATVPHVLPLYRRRSVPRNSAAAALNNSKERRVSPGKPPPSSLSWFSQAKPISHLRLETCVEGGWAHRTVGETRKRKENKRYVLQGTNQLYQLLLFFCVGSSHITIDLTAQVFFCVISYAVFFSCQRILFAAVRIHVVLVVFGTMAYGTASSANNAITTDSRGISSLSQFVSTELVSRMKDQHGHCSLGVYGLKERLNVNIHRNDKIKSQMPAINTRWNDRDVLWTAKKKRMLTCRHAVGEAGVFCFYTHAEGRQPLRTRRH